MQDWSWFSKTRDYHVFLLDLLQLSATIPKKTIENIYEVFDWSIFVCLNPIKFSITNEHFWSKKEYLLLEADPACPALPSLSAGGGGGQGEKGVHQKK